MMIPNQIKPSFNSGSNDASKVPTPTRRRAKAMPKIKPSVVAIYAGLFALVITFVSVGYSSTQASPSVANVANVDSVTKAEQTSVDSVVATNVAAVIAQSANLPVATSVANLAVSVQIKSEFEQSNGTTTTKPQIIASSVENRSVKSYTVVAGDTVGLLASKFGISTQTIKWANNLTTDALTVGTTLRILPINGILYDVKSSDTVDTIASKYGVDKTRLIGYNDLEISGLVPNTKIILPDGVLPNNERPGYVAPVVINYFSGASGGFDGRTWYIRTGTPDDGPYAHGNCTLYAFNRRVELGLPVGGSGSLSQWGNASSWAYLASQVGLLVNRTPSVGAIMQNGGGFGHVAIVESVLENGDISISEMNAYVSGGGYNIVSGRIVPAANVGQYLFIH